MLPRRGSTCASTRSWSSVPTSIRATALRLHLPGARRRVRQNGNFNAAAARFDVRIDPLLVLGADKH
jgi:hypothetical protein